MVVAITMPERQARAPSAEVLRGSLTSHLLRRGSNGAGSGQFAEGGGKTGWHHGEFGPNLPQPHIRQDRNRPTK